jgi:hypothetical protein
LITRIYDHYPLSTHRKGTREFIDNVISEQVRKRNVVSTSAKTALQTKDLNGMSIQLRLQALNSRAVLAVTERLSSELRNIKVEEREATKTNDVKAAAQRRIIRPNVEDRTVRSLIHWMYGQQALVYDDAEHLYVSSPLLAVQ